MEALHAFELSPLPLMCVEYCLLTKQGVLSWLDVLQHVLHLQPCGQDAPAVAPLLDKASAGLLCSVRSMTARRSMPACNTLSMTCL